MIGRTAKKPLFISALPDHIDFCVDLTQLLEQILKLDKQVFLFTGDTDIIKRLDATKEKWIILLQE